MKPPLALNLLLSRIPTTCCQEHVTFLDKITLTRYLNVVLILEVLGCQCFDLPGVCYQTDSILTHTHHKKYTAKSVTTACSLEHCRLKLHYLSS